MPNYTVFYIKLHGSFRPYYKVTLHQTTWSLLRPATWYLSSILQVILHQKTLYSCCQTTRYLYVKSHSTFTPNYTVPLCKNHTVHSHQTTRYLHVKITSTFTPNYTVPSCKITQYIHTKLHGNFM